MMLIWNMQMTTATVTYAFGHKTSLQHSTTLHTQNELLNDQQLGHDSTNTVL